MGELERLIMAEDHEIAGVFGRDGRLILAPKRGTADAIDFVEEEAPYLRGSIVTHNHPGGGAFSNEDVVLAVEQDLSETRAVCPDGTVYRLVRPKGDWPEFGAMIAIVEASVDAFRRENALRRAHRSPIMKERERDDLIFKSQQNGFASIGVQMGRSDVWRR